MNRTSIHTNPARRLTAGLLWLWLAAAALCCAACVRDNIDDDGGFTNDDDAAAYMVCQIAPTTSGVFTRGGTSVSGPETRADEFDNGDETEYALAPGNYHFILLYDSRKGNSTPEAVISLQSPDAIANGPETGVTQTLVAVFGIKQEQVDDFKAFLNNFEALALLNFDPYQLDLVTNAADGWVTKTPEEIMASPLAKKSELMGRTVNKGSIEVNDTKYYTMTSSVYLNGSSTIYGCEKKSDELYDSKQRAIAAALRGEANIVTYVERIVAKVVPMFNVDGNGYLNLNRDASQILFFEGLWDEGPNDSGNHDYDVITGQRQWRARLVGYGLNGLEQGTNLFKDFKNTTYWTGNKKLNDSDHHRSYWAEDTHYTVDDDTKHYYPHQYRTALENDTIRDYHRDNRREYPRLIDQWTYGGTDLVPDWEDHEEFTVHLKEPGENDLYYLKYIPFSTLRDGGNDRTWSNNNLNATNSTAKPEAFYLLENTYDDRSNKLSDRGYFTAGTHLLVACQLEIADQSGTTFRTYDHIYKDQNDIFYAGNHITVGNDNTDEGMRELLKSKFDLLANKALLGGNVGLNILHVDWLNHDPVEDYTKPLEWPIGSKLYIARYTQSPNVWSDWSEWMAQADSWLDLTLIPAELTGGDGQLLIAPRWHDNKFAIGILGDPDNFIELTYDEIVSLFHKLVGPIDHYKNGYMYYAAPVGHNTSNTNWVSKEVGSVGVVRNHAYTINVNSISAPGRSVDMVGQPIIPLLDVKRDYIDVSVKILDWHGIWQDNIPMQPTQ